MRTKRYVLVRAKICNVGIAMILITLFLALITCYKPEYWPAFVFSVVICVLVLIPAFYLVEKEKEV